MMGTADAVIPTTFHLDSFFRLLKTIIATITEEMPPPELDLHYLIEPSKQLCQIWMILILQKEKLGTITGRPANIKQLGGSRLCMPLKHVVNCPVTQHSDLISG